MVASGFMSRAKLNFCENNFVNMRKCACQLFPRWIVVRFYIRVNIIIKLVCFIMSYENYTKV